MTHTTKAQQSRWPEPGPNAQIVTTDGEGRALDFVAGKDLQVLESIRRDAVRAHKVALEHCIGTAKVLQAAQEQAAHAEKEREMAEERLGTIDRAMDAVRDGGHR